MVDHTQPQASSAKFMAAADVSPPSSRKLAHKRSMDCVLNVDNVSRLEQLRHTYSANNIFSPRRKSADVRLVARHSEVYEPCDDSFALVDALLADRINLTEQLQPRICLEIGSGSGYVISSLALMLEQEEIHSHFIATDINPAATRTTLKTLSVHGVSAEVILTDLVSGLEKRLEKSVDLLVFNPPYVPTPGEEVGAPGITGSWAGGDRGRVVIDRVLSVVDSIMSSRGWVYLVTLTANNPGEICRIMQSKGFASRIAVQRYTEEESLHVLKFWRDPAMASSGASCSSASCSSSGFLVSAGSSSGSSSFASSISCSLLAADASSAAAAAAASSSPLMCLPHKISRLAFWRS